MKALDRFVSLAVLGVIAGGLALAGCNTVEGAGKDVKSVGKAVEEEAAEHH